MGNKKEIKLYSVSQPITITPYIKVEATSSSEALKKYQRAVISNLHGIFDVVSIDIPEDNLGLKIDETIPY
ncbi:MAG: hypothetical protein II214_07020 [Alistipes sp.]|nr:hypothetical protein [Alistipes sp.]